MVDKHPISLSISPDIGTVSGEYIVPEKPICIMTLAHGAGAGMNHSFMIAIAKSLAEMNIATLRFNFPFTEHTKKRPDVPAVAHKTIAAAIDHARALYPSLPLFVSGKSFGGRMSSQYLAATGLSIVKGLVFFGFPLHPSGKPSIERAAHLKDVKAPMLFLQGTRDELATFNLIEAVCKTLPLSTLVPIEGADHAFKAGKQDIIPVLTNTCKTWIEKTLKK
ncbi:MAG TPA: alpha/beta family hydrolase [Chitinophagaceae bacterium]|nr:alpha/beta family hydrolase [Chitinophagaceae bacterium]